MLALGDALCAKVCAELAGHSRLKADADAFTLSLKLMTMVELTGTLVAPLTGVVLLTLGAVSPPPHGATVIAVFRGAGAPAKKSPLLLSVSVQPAPARDADVVLLRVAVGPAPSKQFVVVPKPTKSMTAVGQEPDRVVVESTSATLPAPAAIGIVPATSAVGGTTPHGAPEQLVPAAS